MISTSHRNAPFSAPDPAPDSVPDSSVDFCFHVYTVFRSFESRSRGVGESKNKKQRKEIVLSSSSIAHFTAFLTS
jgi:hypothetical protein